MTDTKPTIEEQIKWIQSAVKAHENSGHILAILKELAAIKSQPVPVEVEVAKEYIPKRMVVAAHDCDTLLSAYKRVKAEREQFKRDAERHLKERDLLVSEYERAVKCGEQGYVHAVMHLYNAITNAKIDAAIDSARNK